MTMVSKYNNLWIDDVFIDSSGKVNQIEYVSYDLSDPTQVKREYICQSITPDDARRAFENGHKVLIWKKDIKDYMDWIN